MTTPWVALAIALCSAQLAGAEQLPSTGNLLERYSRGDFAAFTPPRTPVDVERFRQALEHDAASWLRGGDARTQRRRHLTAATIALEAAHASLDLSWAQGRQLIEWGSALLRKAPPDEAERRWHLAALSVIQGAYDNELLVKQQKLAWPRFEGEPRFLLALMVMVEGDTWPDPDRGQPWDSDEAGLEAAHEMDAARRARRQASQPDLREKANEYERRTRMRRTIELLEDLSNAEAIRPETVLRLGHLHLRLQHVEIALEQFDEVLAMTDDPFLVYLAHFLGGRAREQQGDQANAMASYRAALNIIPRAQSASLALSSLLFVANARDEAARLIDAAITVPVAEDPWRAYQAGDFRFWAERIASLREAFR